MGLPWRESRRPGGVRAAGVGSRGFGVVPPTVMRDGPYGRGMCQRWVNVDPDGGLVDVVPPDFDEPGWIAVLEAEDHRERPVLLVHADDDRLRDMALLDVVINNADRKGGHVLVEPEPTSRVWGWTTVSASTRSRSCAPCCGAGRTSRCATATPRSCACSTSGARVPWATSLEQHLSRIEVNALRYRIDRLLDAGQMPSPGDRWPVIPWPAF